MPRSTLTYGILSLICLGPTSALHAKDEPPATVVPAPRDGSWLNRHKTINDRAKQGEVDLLFLGDSITQGWEKQDAWKKYYGARHAMNAGISGDRTQHVLWRLDNGNVDGISPKLIVMMIGTNNTGNDSPEDIAVGIKAIVARLREKLPQSKILLLGVFPRGEQPDDEKRQATIEINKLIKPAADGKNVIFLDIGEKFVQPDGTISKEIMYDFLHLTSQGYELWAEAIEPVVSEQVGSAGN